MSDTVDLYPLSPDKHRIPRFIYFFVSHEQSCSTKRAVKMSPAELYEEGFSDH